MQKTNYISDIMTARDARKYREKYPEKYRARKASMYLPRPKDMVAHHWSYNDEHFKDVIFISARDHKLIHRYLIYDQIFKVYFSVHGDSLDSRESHIEYIKTVIEFLKHNPGKLPEVAYSI